MAADASRPSVEWRTVAVAVAVHGLWLAAVALHASTPWPLTVVALAVATAWHGSLQHETIHGHPFRSRRLNSLVGSLPISVRLPYPVYRRYHLAHHDCADLTDPTDDSESFYVSVEQWESKGRLGRAFLLAHHTLLGRLVLGPPHYIIGVIVHQARQIRRGDRELARWWSGHIVASAALVAFVVMVMGVPWWQYVLGATYLGNAATLMRSYCEHRWVEGATRSAVVRSGRFFSMLYLYNNLHHVHHADPGVPWYRLSAHADATGGYEEAAAGAGLYRGYFELARRFLLRPFDHPVHPAERTALTSNL
jgi:fatty acid desaturase